jgi:hypothetical protein
VGDRNEEHGGGKKEEEMSAHDERNREAGERLP